MRGEAAMKLYLTTACFPSTVLSDASRCVFKAKLSAMEVTVDLCTTVGAQQVFSKGSRAKLVRLRFVFLQQFNI